MNDVTYKGYGFDKFDILHQIDDSKTKSILTNVFDHIQKSTIKQKTSKSITVDILESNNSYEFSLLFLISEKPIVVKNPTKFQPLISYAEANQILLSSIVDFDNYTKKLIVPKLQTKLLSIINQVATDKKEWYDDFPDIDQIYEDEWLEYQDEE